MKAEQDIPDALLPPELLPRLECWLDAFHELSTDRQFGMGAGPLPAASIDRWTEGWPDDDAWAFRHCMRALDAVYLEKRDKGRKPLEVANGEDRLRAIFGDRID